jgi:hypothetical protein
VPGDAWPLSCIVSEPTIADVRNGYEDWANTHLFPFVSDAEPGAVITVVSSPITGLQGKEFRMEEA